MTGGSPPGVPNGVHGGVSAPLPSHLFPVANGVLVVPGLPWKSIAASTFGVNWSR
ncbi:hypothetical protein ACFQYP_32960 [Nonomuraea antimicrobica]